MSSALIPQSFVDRLLAAGTTPCNVHLELELPHRLDVDRVEDAAAATVRRHPILRARRRADTPAWAIQAAGEPPVVTVVDAHETTIGALRGRAVSTAFDIEREPPIRFIVARTEATDRLIAVADHAAVDGIGIQRVGRSFLEHYGGISAAEPDDTWQSATDLRSRGDVDASGAAAFRPRSRPTPVRLARSCDRDVAGSGVVYRTLGSAVGERLRAASTPHVTANDVIVAAFCDTGMHWNIDHGAPAVPFTTGVPVNLRPYRTWSEGVCNATLVWPVRIERAGADGLVDHVAAQVRPVRRGRLSPAVAALASDLSRSPGVPLWARHVLGSSTTVVSSVPTRVRSFATGSGEGPRVVLGGAPASPSMPLTFAVMAGGEQVHISARYLRSHHTAGDVHRFLADVERSIEALVWR